MTHSNDRPKTQTVLIVDDTTDNVALISALLRPLYRTKVAISGDEALDVAVSEDPPDLILLDIKPLTGRPVRQGKSLRVSLQGPQTEGD